VCLVGSGLCYELIARSEESLPGVCACVIVCDLETLKRGGLGLIWAVEPHKNIYCFTYEGCNFNSGNYLFTTDTK